MNMSKSTKNQINTLTPILLLRPSTSPLADASTAAAPAPTSPSSPTLAPPRRSPLAYDVTDGVPEGYVFSGKPQEEIELFMAAAPESFRRGMEAAEEEIGRRVSCLVSDAFFWFAAEMAAAMAVPWVSFWTAGADSLSIHVYTDLGSPF